MSPILGSSNSAAHHGGRPPAAIELTPEGVLAASLPGKKNELPVYAFDHLRPGVLVPGISELNMSSRRGCFSPSATRSPVSRRVAASSPSSSLIPRCASSFSTSIPCPRGPAEAIPVLRFRLRKMVPFEVEHAGLSYQILSQSKTEARVLVAVLPSKILEEYETVVRAAGYEPGSVMPSALAALATP